MSDSCRNPGFNFHFTFVLIIGLSVVILLSYLVFS